MFDEKDAQGTLRLLRSAFPFITDLYLESEYPITKAAFNLLSQEDVELIDENVLRAYGSEEHRFFSYYKDNDLPHFRREVLRYGAKLAPEIVGKKTGLVSDNPPAHIHSMMRSEPFAGDLYHGDLIVSALKRAGISIADGGTYMDFGCSSGALVRNMRAAFPSAFWIGCDPQSASIVWATSSLQGIRFFESPQDPPLDCASASLDGCYAISIWSHFSERAAIAWLEEMCRLIVPGGFLAFTTHGWRSLYYYLSESIFPVWAVARFGNNMLTSGFAFQDVWVQDDPAADGLTVSDWGNAYFTVEWLLRNSQGFELLDFQPGRSQFNQDVYVLRRSDRAVA